jgi:hypothetical protein
VPPEKEKHSKDIFAPQNGGGDDVGERRSGGCRLWLPINSIFNIFYLKLIIQYAELYASASE